MTSAGADTALLALGRVLKAGGYAFTTSTPLTHGRVMARPADPQTANWRDIFGWNRAFTQQALAPELFSLLSAANALAAEGGVFRSLVRFSTLHDLLLLHSGYPTDDAASVFFGPDTYRFAHALREAVAVFPETAPRLIVDIGAGSGVGGLLAASWFSRGTPPKVLLTDINHTALRYCLVNAALNEARDVEVRQSDVFAAIPEAPDLVIANPPYLVDAKRRQYRHGGGSWGSDLSLRILTEALERLAPGGAMILYTGATIVDGVDKFREQALPVLERFCCTPRYYEMDTDVFGEELAHSPYDRADRIAAVVLIVRKTGPSHAA